MKTTEHAHQLLTYEEAARFLGIPVGTLYTWVSLKRIPHIRFSGRLVRFDIAELDRWIEDRRVRGSLRPDSRSGSVARFGGRR